MTEYKEKKGTLYADDGLKLFCQSWESEKPEALIVIAHGLGEHSGRYQNLIDCLQGQAVSFYALDHRGHGQSEGKRGHIERFSDYVLDLKKYIDLVKAECPGLPLILLGHSMGGVIALQFALQYPEDIDALILSSAGLIPAVSIPGWQEKMARLLSRLAPRFSMSNGLDAAGLSHDKQVVEQYIADPLVHDKVSARWYTEFTDAGQNGLERTRELSMPLLIIHGKSDPIVDYRGSVQLLERASSRDKTIYLFEGLFHETMNETLEERQQVLEKMNSWIIEHLDSLKRI